MTDPWPWPDDLPVDRARRIANNLLALLPEEDVAQHVATARGLGETWLGAELLRFDVTDVISTRQAADLVHVGASTIRKWHSQGYLPHHRTGWYVVAAVLECSAARRRVRAGRPAGPAVVSG